MKYQTQIFVETKLGLLSLNEISNVTGISEATIYSRYFKGVRGDDLLRPLMRKKLEEYIGMKVGHLTIIGIDRGGRKPIAICECTCGNKCKRVLSLLVNRDAPFSSCGCMKSTASSTHGLGKSREHRIWANMIRRCNDKSGRAYKHYGERGIYVCDRWLDSFVNFWNDMGPAPGAEYSLDRVDNDGPYSPENCRWATRLEQARNKRSTVFISFMGESKSTTEWEDFFGIRRGRLWCAMNSGKDPVEYLEKLKEMKDKYGDCNRRIDTGHVLSRK